jgi:hypothetical protein
MPITADALFRDVCSRLPAATAPREDWIGLLLQAFLVAREDFMALAATATPTGLLVDDEWREACTMLMERWLSGGCAGARSKLRLPARSRASPLKQASTLMHDIT